MKSSQKLRIKINVATNRIGRCCSQHVDEYALAFIRKGRKDHQQTSKSTNNSILNPGAWAFLVMPQKAAKKSQEYEEKPPCHFSQSAVMQADAFSCTPPNFIQATRKACLPTRRAALFLLKSEKESRKNPLVSLFNLYPSAQVVVISELPFSSTHPTFATVRRKIEALSHPRHPRHPWPIAASSAFSAVKPSPLSVLSVPPW
jgi:hypothetical protein